jgi:superfamily II DNA/RNA helicase
VTVHDGGRRTPLLIERATFPGRTGRFGRKGISINFVHDKNTWAQMEEIEKATGKGITRIETTDLDVMEEVRVMALNSCLLPWRLAHANMSYLANEEGYEVVSSELGVVLYNRCSGRRSEKFAANLFCICISVVWVPPTPPCHLQ